ncbi:dinucleotide-utilizing enzyme [Microbacterium sp. 2MCAF23]|uniref:dinucleotide-utilizing enzyme n=1 Tax=Microbacterium sp. 2MCAF23 TaxID=3232985 RepID=UPI003F9DC184
MTRALNRSLPFWILVVASIGLIAAGVLTVLDHLGTMTATLKDGSATGLEVYGGQSWIVLGSALIGAGALGVLLALALTVLSTLLGAATAQPVDRAPLAFDDVDLGPEPELDPEGALDAPVAPHEIEREQQIETEADEATTEEAQKGSNGSIATATKISVK